MLKEKRVLMDDNQLPQQSNAPNEAGAPPTPPTDTQQTLKQPFEQVSNQQNPTTTTGSATSTPNEAQNTPTQPQVVGPTVIGPQMSQPSLDNIQTNPTQAQPNSIQQSPIQSDAINPQNLTQQPNQTTVSGPAMPSSPPVMPDSKKPKSKKLLVPIVVVSLLLVGGAAAAYNSFILNSPEGLWKRAMQTTAAGFDEFVEIASEETAKGGTIEGSFKFSSPTVVDGTVTGKWFENNSQYNIDVGFAGLRPMLELRTISKSEGVAPDLYIKLDNISGLEALLGAANPSVTQLVAEINGSWFVIDHTLYEQALASGNSQNLEVSQEEIREIGNNLSEVLRERLFTDDSEKAVVVVDEAIGEEDFEGDSAYKYKVIVRKEQTKEFVKAIVESLEETKVEELLKQESEKSLYEYLNTDELIESIERMDFSNATAEVWVNMDTKLVRNVRITPESENGEVGYIDFGLPYDGGDEIPFKISVTYTDGENDEKGSASLEVMYNKSSKAVSAAFNTDINQSGQKIVAEGKLTSTPSNEEVIIDVPEGARNIYELLGYIYGGTPLNGLSGGTLGDDTDKIEIPFLDTLQL